jgi:hypothetical protein
MKVPTWLLCVSVRLCLPSWIILYIDGDMKRKLDVSSSSFSVKASFEYLVTWSYCLNFRSSLMQLVNLSWSHCLSFWSSLMQLVDLSWSHCLNFLSLQMQLVNLSWSHCLNFQFFLSRNSLSWYPSSSLLNVHNLLVLKPFPLEQE